MQEIQHTARQTIPPEPSAVRGALRAGAGTRLHAVCMAFCLVLLSASGIFCAGCGCGAPSESDAAPFRAAVEEYLRQHDMGMRVYRFHRLDVRGDRATAEVSLREASGTVGVGVRWRFEFVRKNGRWVVSRRL